MTKDQILSNLSQLDEKTLQRLYDYSQVVKMLYPQEDLLLNANMAQMVDKANELANIYLPQWTDRGDGDFGQFLVELVALFSEKDYWYNNAYSLEGNLSTMIMYRNVYARAIEMGYDPQLQTAPSASFEVVFEALAAIDASNPVKVYQPGDLVVSLQGTRTKFTNRDSFSIPDSLSASTLTLTLYNGQIKEKTYSFNGDHIYVEDDTIETSSVRVYVNGSEWSLVPQLGNSESSDNHFIVYPERLGAVSIYFGDSEFGAMPSIGDSVRVVYLKTPGFSGNVTFSSPFTISSSSSVRPATSATALVSAGSGGLDLESLESIRNNAVLRSRNRATIINTTDAENYLTSLSNVYKAKALFINQQLLFYAIGTDGLSLSQPSLDAIASGMEDIIVQLDYQIGGSQPNYVTLPAMDFKIEAKRGYDKSKMKVQAEAAIRDFYDPLVLGDFGKPFVHDDLFLYIQKEVEGIARMNIYERGTTTQVADTIPVADQEILKKMVTSSSDPARNAFVTVQDL